MTRIANIDGLKVIERFFDLPLDYSKPDGETIRVFARHMIPKDKAKTKEAEDKLPFCKSPSCCSWYFKVVSLMSTVLVVYLQGSATIAFLFSV